MIDWYTKSALTIIAIALVTIAIQQTIGTAQSQTTPAQTTPLCGARDNPCSVTNYCQDRSANEWRLCDTFFRQ